MDVSITIPAQTVTIPEETVNVTIPVAGIVYQNSWLAQTSAIANSNVFSLPSDGLYRMTLGIACDAIPAPPYNGVSVSPVATTSVTGFSVTPTGGGRGITYSCNEISFYGVSGEEVSFGMGVSGSGTFTATVYLTIEQLQ